MDLLTELKARTRPHHDRIEAALNPMRPGLTLADYTTMLGRMYGFYAAWEAAAERHFAGDRHDFFERRRKLPLLERDLAHLGVDVSDLPPCAALPGNETFADVLGSVYVLEGSTLGGQFIGRHLAATLGLTPATGAAFFASYGPQVGPMWRETQQFLVAHGGGIEEAVVAAAGATFEALGRWASGQTSHTLATAGVK